MFSLGKRSWSVGPRRSPIAHDRFPGQVGTQDRAKQTFVEGHPLEIVSKLENEGDRESSGRFSIDIERAWNLLDKFILPDPQHYIKHIVGAAVAAGATQVKARLKAGMARLEYDGESLSPAQLENLFSSLLLNDDNAGGQMRELAIAVNNARILGYRITISGSQARAVVQNQELVVTPHSGRENSVELSRGVIQNLVRATVRKETEILRKFCAFAPVSVEINGQTLAPIDVGACLSIARFDGGGRQPRVAARPLHSADHTAKYSGIVVLGAPNGFVLTVHGVSYELEAALPFEDSLVVVAADHLPTDVGGAQLVKGDRYSELIELSASWCGRAVLQAAKELRGEPRVMPYVGSLLERHWGALFESTGDRMVAEVGQLELPTAGGHRTLAGLIKLVREQGYLLATESRVPGFAASQDVLLTQKQSGERLTRLLNLINVTDVDWDDYPRIDEECLVRVPMVGAQGEICLAQSPYGAPRHVSVVEAGRQPQDLQADFPEAVTLVTQTVADSPLQAEPEIDRLYRALMRTQPKCDLNDHLLDYLAYRVDALGKEVPAEATQRVTLKNAVGRPVSLHELLCGEEPIRARVFDLVPAQTPDLSEETLLVTRWQYRRLSQLLGRRLQSPQFFTDSATRCLEALVHKGWVIDHNDILMALLEEGGTALQILQELQVDLTDLVPARLEATLITNEDVFAPSGARVLSLAEEEAVRLHTPLCGTVHLLLGLLRDPALSANLRRRGVTLEEVRRRAGLDEEVLSAMAAILNAEPNSLDYLNRSHYYLHHGELDLALADALTAVSLNPVYVVPWSHLAIVQGMVEDLDSALRSIHRALEIDGEYRIARVNLAYLLMVAGELDAAEETARQIVSQDDSGHVHAVLGRIALLRNENSEALGFSERALEQDSSIGWALDVRAQALERLGELDAAVESYERFLEVEQEYGLVEYGLQERLQAARDALLRLGRAKA